MKNDDLLLDNWIAHKYKGVPVDDKMRSVIRKSAGYNMYLLGYLLKRAGQVLTLPLLRLIKKFI